MLHVVLTAVGPGERPRRRDVVVRAGGHRLVTELADDLAAWLGLPNGEAGYALIVDRTGEHLIPERRLDQVDLREGDIVMLLPPGQTPASRTARRPMRRLPDR